MSEGEHDSDFPRQVFNECVDSCAEFFRPAFQKFRAAILVFRMRSAVNGTTRIL